MEARMKSLDRITERMSGIEEGSLRYHVLESAKNFKTSWVELGRSLYSVWKDKHYKEWGYATFDAYTAKEIGIRTQTAMKLLRSYFFLEKEEPAYLRSASDEPAEAARLPSYEAVDVLRQAKNKKGLDRDDYDALKRDVFEKGKDVREVRKDLTSLIRSRQELEPEEAFEKKKETQVRRMVGVLKSLKNEAELSKTLPASLIREIASLIHKLETAIA